jgi:hypothetical protein
MATSIPAAGTSTQSTLSDWAGPYVTNMLGQAQAIAAQPYQVYGGPLTAGPSDLQNQVFQGLGSLNFPSNLGQSFSNTSAYAPPPTGGSIYGIQPIGTGQDGTGTQVAGGQMGGMGQGLGSLGAQQPTGIAGQYMNPYLQNVLDPQLAEMRRQNDITQMKTNAGLTSQGAFGGGRQAIMNSENNRNMMQQMNQAIGTGYSNAYDKAMQQFNTEQGQAKTLADMIAQQGATQQGINQAGVTADYNEFLAQRDYPMKQTQYLQSMLQGLPISTVSTSPASMTGLGALQSTVGTLGSTYDLLSKLKLV